MTLTAFKEQVVKMNGNSLEVTVFEDTVKDLAQRTESEEKYFMCTKPAYVVRPFSVFLLHAIDIP